MATGLGRYCCKSPRARWVQLFQDRAAASRKNTWGSTRPTALATGDFPSRLAMPASGVFSSRRLSRRFSTPPIFRLLQHNRPNPDPPPCANHVLFPVQPRPRDATRVAGHARAREICLATVNMGFRQAAGGGQVSYFQLRGGARCAPTATLCFSTASKRPAHSIAGDESASSPARLIERAVEGKADVLTT
jgi:hypothetical protein